VLLEQTLRGVVKTLTDVLAITNPVSFGRASRIKSTVSRLAQALQTPEPWQAEVAAMLSQLGCIALAPETAERVHHGKPLSAEEAEAVARIPAVTEQLIGHIPRLEVVRGILSTYERPYRRPGPNESEGQAAQIHRGAQLVKVAVDFDALESVAQSGSTAFDALRARAVHYDPDVLAALQSLVGPDSTHVLKEVKLSELEVGMVFDEDIRLDGGTLLVGRGLEVTAGMVERMRNVQRGSVKEPVRVKIALPQVVA
jgi:response regulator RpfG family c-di-GMP phosphodiesterase